MAEEVGLTSSVSAVRAPARTVVFEIVGSNPTLGEAEIGSSVTLVAEEVGFEPTVGLTLRSISSRVP